jgi:hypothetical protein
MSKLGRWLTIRSTAFETLKNIAETVAFLVAAAWGIFTFGVKDSPSLQQSLSSDQSLEIDSVATDRCSFNLKVQIKNAGKSSFQIDSVQINYWLLPSEEITNDSFFDFDAYMKKQLPRSTRMLRTIGLVHNYPPESEDYETFFYVLPRSYDMAVIFNVTLFSERSTLFFFHKTDSNQFFYWNLHNVPEKNIPETKNKTMP